MPSVPADVLWEVLLRDAGACITILDAQGRILYVNRIAADFLFKASPQEIVGLHAVQLLPAAVASERLEVLDRLRQSNRPILFQSVWRGRQTTSIWRHLPPDEAHEQERFFILMRPEGPGEGLDLSRYELMEAGQVDLGPLSVLSPRELEVLALIGEGLRLKDIAARLVRSVKTIERHRESIGLKLGVKDRAKLIELAKSAGLEAPESPES